MLYCDVVVFGVNYIWVVLKFLNVYYGNFWFVRMVMDYLCGFNVMGKGILWVDGVYG